MKAIAIKEKAIYKKLLIFMLFDCILHAGGSMPTLQVRDLPEDLYVKLSRLAAQEHRSLAQQTIKLIEEGLKAHQNRKFQRRALLQEIEQRNYPDTSEIDTVQLVREDRER